jgi:hypothetical protein
MGFFWKGETESYGGRVLCTVWSLSAGSGQCAVGQDTHPPRLTPKTFQVLCYLAARPGQLVTKAEAIAPLKQRTSRFPHILAAHLALASAYNELGQSAEAQGRRCGSAADQSQVLTRSAPAARAGQRSRDARAGYCGAT